MSAALISALIFTVVLFVTTAYFLMGAIPLLILKHDTDLDSRFVRGFFNTNYLAAMVAGGATALSYAWAGNLIFSAGAAALALLAAVLRRTLIPRMDAHRSQIQERGTAAVPGFRRMHLSAILLNLVQLVLIVGSLIVFPLSK